LTKGIDEWEAAGAVVQMNARLRDDSDAAAGARWRASLRHTHRASARTRRALVTRPQEAQWRAAWGGGAFEHAMASGLAGVTAGRDDDIKCCHAQLADLLVRCGGPRAGLGGDVRQHNAVGEAIVAELAARGYAMQGSPRCAEQCGGCGDAKQPPAGRWNYLPVKNKQGLRRRRDRRRAAESKHSEDGNTPHVAVVI
jgi:hypothetical protein